MQNREELIKALNNIKSETKEAVMRGTKQEYIDKLINAQIRIYFILEEHNKMKEVMVEDSGTELAIDSLVDELKPLAQDKIVDVFRDKTKQVLNKYKDHTSVKISKYQKETILGGIKDRIGIENTEEIIKFVNNFNYNQADDLIKFLKKISFYNQRVEITEGMKESYKKSDNKLQYKEAFSTLYKNIWSKTWIDENKDILGLVAELNPPTEPQINKIVNVAKYPETAVALKDFGIDIRDYEYRPNTDEGQKLYYIMNWELLRQDVRKKFHKESAKNFIQTYDYISNMYEGKTLDKDQRAHIRELYIRLGEYELTRPSHLNVITKQYYNYISIKLEEAVRIEKIVNNTANQKFRDFMEEELYRTNSHFRKINTLNIKDVNQPTIELRNAQEQAKDLTSFVRNLYQCIGQDVPDEMRDILPHFVQRGECDYSGVEEQHYAKFRKLVFEQRDVIKSVDKDYNWAYNLLNQPTHVLKALGLDIMI